MQRYAIYGYQYYTLIKQQEKIESHTRVIESQTRQVFNFCGFETFLGYNFRENGQKSQSS